MDPGFSMFPTLAVLALAALAYWAGFRAEPHPAQFLSQAAFLIFLSLAVFAGYFAWQETRAVKELAGLIEPVPGIQSVSYVPTAGETRAIADFLAAIPGRTMTGFSPEERSALAQEVRVRDREYWLVTTALESDSVMIHYRDAALRAGWTVEGAEGPWLFLGRSDGVLTLFVSSRTPRPGSKVLHSFRPR